MLDLSVIFAALVLTLLLTAIIYIFLDNKKNIKFPDVGDNFFDENKTERNLVKSLVISLVIVIIFLLFKFRNRL